MTERSPSAEEIKEAVVESYGARAREKLASMKETPGGEQIALEEVSSCCEPSCCGPSGTTTEEKKVADLLYAGEELRDVPADAADFSLGCGNPTALAELREGETVLDLGSGGGLDCFLAAKKVGPRGRVVGLDMSPDMIQVARRNVEKMKAANVEFRLGEMEYMPFADETFDVIISNCVINLSPDKDVVFREAFRVMRPGGRLRVSDIVWTRKPTPKEVSDLSSWAGCVAGAVTNDDYLEKLQAAGFENVTTELAPDPDGRGWTSANVRADKQTK
jgi:SAM-dependent methyltransferase